MNTKIFLKKFLPDLFFSKKKIVTEYKDSILDIEFEKYKALKVIIFDFDDTLSGFLGEISDKYLSFLKNLQEKGYRLAVYSNSSNNRTKFLDEYLKKLGIYNVKISDKPNTGGYFEILKHFDVPPESVMMVGDRIGTDIYGAYLAQIKHRVLIRPYSSINSSSESPAFVYKIVRAFERDLYFLIRRLRK